MDSSFVKKNKGPTRLPIFMSLITRGDQSLNSSEIPDFWGQQAQQSRAGRLVRQKIIHLGGPRALE
jgi:hypothetical protein